MIEPHLSLTHPYHNSGWGCVSPSVPVSLCFYPGPEELAAYQELPSSSGTLALIWLCIPGPHPLPLSSPVVPPLGRSNLWLIIASDRDSASNGALMTVLCCLGSEPFSGPQAQTRSQSCLASAWEEGYGHSCWAVISHESFWWEVGTRHLPPCHPVTD